MIDSVIAGTGNSRYLRTSLAADTTWEDALTMLRAGTFPIDLAGINAAGFTTVGTALTSATLLKAAVCTALGLDADATPSDAWEEIISRVNEKLKAPTTAGTPGQFISLDNDLNVVWVTRPPEIFFATYGTTTSAEIEAAYQAGKVCLAVNGSRTFILGIHASSTSHTFFSATYGTVYQIKCDNNSWTNTSRPIPAGSSDTPEPLGTAAAGDGTTYARSNHVHPMPSPADLGAATIAEAYGAYPEDSVNAPFAAFPDGADDIPVKNLTVSINPIQDLHGYTAPWPTGGGANIYPNCEISGTANELVVSHDSSTETYSLSAATISTYSQVISSESFTIKAGTYYLKTFKSSTLSGVYPQLRSTDGTTTYQNGDGSFTFSSDTTVKARIVAQASTVIPSNFTMQLAIVSGSTAPASWTPYSNICPISGWTGATILRAGVNLFNKTTATLGKSISGTGSITNRSGTDAFYSDFIPIYAEVGMKYRHTAPGVSGKTMRICLYDRNKNWIRSEATPSAGGNTCAITINQTDVDSGAAYLRISAYSAGVYDYAMCTVGDDVAQEYSSYAGTAYPITFPSEAGTVYAGTLDVTTGVLTVTWSTIDLGNLTWDTNGVRFASSAVVGKKFGNHNILCSAYKVATATSVTDMGDMEIKGNASGRVLYVIDSRFDTKEAFQSAVNGVQLIFELDEPITYQLTPQEVTTLLGLNNLWADTGDTTVVYRADPTLYIQKLTGSTEDDMIANESIASGKYFMVGNRLFYSTAAIAAGAMLTVGTNCEETNLAAALNAINS